MTEKQKQKTSVKREQVHKERLKEVREEARRIEAAGELGPDNRSLVKRMGADHRAEEWINGPQYPPQVRFDTEKPTLQPLSAWLQHHKRTEQCDASREVGIQRLGRATEVHQVGQARDLFSVLCLACMVLYSETTVVRRHNVLGLAQLKKKKLKKKTHKKNV